MLMLIVNIHVIVAVWSSSEDGTIACWSISPSITCLKQVSAGGARINSMVLMGPQGNGCVCVYVL